MRMHKLVLLAGPEDEGRLAIETALRAAGHDVAIAGAGSEAVKTALDRNPGLVVIDLELPELSGQAVIEILQRARPHLPLVVLAGDASMEVGRRILQMGVFYFLVKPIDVGELLAAVGSAMAARRAQTAAA